MNATQKMMLLVGLVGLVLTPSASVLGGMNLTNGSRVALTATAGSESRFTIVVPAGADKLEVTTSGGFGDLDLYLNHGREASRKTSTYRSDGRDNSERITINNPTAGKWQVLVVGYRTYGSAVLSVRVSGGQEILVRCRQCHRAPCICKPTRDDSDILTSDVGKTGIDGRTGSERFYRIEVPTGATLLTLVSRGSYGDPDMYIRFDEKPERKRYDAKSDASGSTESIIIKNPKAGTYHVLIAGYRAYSNLTLLATVEPGQDRCDRDDHRRRGDQLRLTSPTAGVIWRMGETVNVTWAGGRRIGKVQPQLSLDGGRRFTLALTRSGIEASTGQLAITFPAIRQGLKTATAVVRIVSVATGKTLATSDVFAIRSARERGRDHDRRRVIILKDAYEAAGNNSYDKNTYISVNQTQQHTISPAGDVDYIRLGTPAVATYNLQITNVTATLNVELYIRQKGKDNKRISSFQVSTAGVNIPLPASSKTYWYTLKVRSANGKCASYTIAATNDRRRLGHRR